MSQGLVTQPCAEPQGLISTWGHLCHADVVLLFVNPANTTGLVRGLRPPERLGCDFQPLLLHCSGRDAYAEYYSGDGADFVLCLAGADGSRRRSTTARKSLDGTVSPAMLTLPRKWLSLPLAALRDIAAPSLLGNGEGVKGDASPRQGAGSV